MEAEREREREGERERERERGSCSSRSSSFGSGDAQDAANCPGSPRWFTAARRRDRPSTAARKSAPRSRTHTDSSKPPLRLHNFHIKKIKKEKKSNTRETPGRLYPPTAASVRPRTTRRTADLTWTYPDLLFNYSDETFLHRLLYTAN
ncbi:putative histone-lysine N-methyltransferase PRDM6 [Lates japonicus]|uniref:Histone-lysine N-methyltransferase PRDM6 n=1 Tax=Lates japonicus TaxID=270547 RepID=A0AAD3RFA3_LATJO|nr:putative histone-lysine N-methyltransferase PRDM6 [Lates japonicus]